jgi:signal transduction histidine kinase/CheY-like chemotaxis protein
MRNMPAMSANWKSWVLALLALALATAANFVLQPAVEGKLPWLLYFPALVFTALYAGLWPSFFVLGAALLVGVSYWMAPYGMPWPSRPADVISGVMFLLGGASVAAVSAWTRQLLHASRNDKLRLDMALSMGHMAAWNWDLPTGRLAMSANARTLFGTRWACIDEALAAAHEEDRARVRQVIDKALASGTEYSFISRMVRADDQQLRWLQTRGHVHRDEDGHALHVSGVTADVTELVSAQEQLRLESQRKDAFLATLAHELRNPMAPIRYATAMLREEATPAQREKARDVIVRQSAHMARLLDDLLDMSRITRDVIELKPEVFDLRTAIEHAVENVRGAFAQRGHRLQVDVPPEAVLIKGDLTRIQQVLGNLLDNAAKYTPEVGQISVQLGREDGRAVVRVTDNGIGIAAEQHAQVFELFSQLHEAGRSPGLGIGLAIVKRLVELHGGSIEVDSAGRGLGSQFIVRLPLAGEDRTEAPSVLPPAARPLGQGQAVLVVDDNPDTADSLAAVLRTSGFTVRVAYDGRSATQLFDAIRPVAVVLDLGLPDMSGADVAAHIRRRPGAHTLLIAVTGWNGQQAPGIESFDVHLVKPVHPDRVVQELLTRLSLPEAA